MCLNVIKPRYSICNPKLSVLAPPRSPPPPPGVNNSNNSNYFAMQYLRQIVHLNRTFFMIRSDWPRLGLYGIIYVWKYNLSIGGETVACGLFVKI